MAEMVKKTNTTRKTTINEETKQLNAELEQDTLVEQEKVLDPRDEEIARLRKENQEKDERFFSLQEQLLALEKKLNQNMNTTYNHISEESYNEDILVGCRAFSPIPLCTSDNRICIIFNGSEEKYISSDDLKELFKITATKNNRSYFENGTFYFVEKSNYDKFKIRVKNDLSKEKVKEIILTTDVNEMIDKVNKISNDLIDRGVLHIFKYTIVELLLDSSNPLKNWSYENRSTLEDYLKVKFDNLIANSGVLKFMTAR